MRGSDYKAALCEISGGHRWGNKIVPNNFVLLDCMYKSSGLRVYFIGLYACKKCLHIHRSRYDLTSSDYGNMADYYNFIHPHDPGDEL